MRHPSGLNALGSAFQFPKNVASEMLFDFVVPRDRLAGTRSWVLIPIMSATMPNELAPISFDLSDEFSPFHAIWSLAIRRTPGM